MDYASQLTTIKKLIDDGYYAQAVLGTGKALEQLSKELYHQSLDRMDAAARKAASQLVEEKWRVKDVDRLTLGQIMGFFCEADLDPTLRGYLSLPLSLMRSFDAQYVKDLRNRAAHGDTPIPEEEAWLCYGLLYKLLSETGQSLPARIPEQRHQSGKPRRPLRLSHDDWTRYSTSLLEALDLEAQMYRVPVDILQNRATGYKQSSLPKSGEDKPWLEIACALDEGLAVLLGDPGEGKTVCFTTVARSLLEEHNNDSTAPLPVRVRLTFYDQHQHPLEELLVDQFRMYGLNIPDAGDVPDILSQRPFFVLLDGLNEVVDHVPLVGELQGLIGQAPDNRYVLSCRKADYDRVKELLPAHKAWQLVPFDADDITRFLAQHLQAEPDRRGRLESWLADERLREVVGTPFFLSLLANLDPVDQPSPKNRAELCQFFVDSFQDRELKARAEQRHVGELWPILEEAAFQMQELRTPYLPTGQFEEISRRVWVEQLYGQETTVSRHETVQALYASPLLTRQEGLVTFKHQLFRDFFAARAVAKRIDTNDPSCLEPLVADSWWDYTIVLLSGLLPDATGVLYGIVYERTNYDLAVTCLREARRFDIRILGDIVDWMRNGGRFQDLLELASVIASVPGVREEWRVAEAEAIVRSCLTRDRALVEPSDLTDFYIWTYVLAFAQSLPGRWPVSQDMVVRAATDALQDASDIVRGNSLLALAWNGQRDTVLDAIPDPSPYVREKLAQSIAYLIEAGDANDLLGAVTELGQAPEVNVRRAAMRAARGLVDRGGLDILLKGLADPDANVRLAALDELMTAEGEQVVEARSRAVILLEDLLTDVLSGAGWPEELEEDPTEQILTALEQIDTPESSNALLVAACTEVANARFVAGILADRGDPRALRALLEEMLDSPKNYFGDLQWLDYVQHKFATMLGHPFELTWLEALLVEEEIFQELGFEANWPAPGCERCFRVDPRSALAVMVEAAENSRPALVFLLRALLMAYLWVKSYGTTENQLLNAAIYRLIEVDPTALAELATDSWGDMVFAEGDIPSCASGFASILAEKTSVLTDALPAGERSC